MGNCITSAISVESLCNGTVSGGLEYVVGFNYDSFKRQYSAQQGTPQEHLQRIVTQSGSEYYSDLVAGLASKGFNQIIPRSTYSATALLTGTTSKPVGAGLFGDATSYNKKGYITSIKVALASVGTHSLNLIVVNNGVTTNYTTVATNLTAGITNFPLPADPLEFDTFQVSFAQTTLIYQYQKTTDFCAPCKGNNVKCPRLKDVTTSGISEFNGGNGILVGLSCACDFECYIFKKIGVLADVRSVLGKYIERRQKKESIFGTNLAVDNLSELNTLRVKQLDKEIEEAITKQLVRIMAAIKNDGNMCFTCGYNTIQSVTNI